MATEVPSKYGFYHRKAAIASWVVAVCGITGPTMLLTGLMMRPKVNSYLLIWGVVMLITALFLGYRGDQLLAKRDREWNTGWFHVTRYAWVSVHNERAANHLYKLSKPGVAGLNPVTLWMGNYEIVCQRPDRGLMDQLVAGQPVYGRLRYSDELKGWELEALPIPGE